jgi:hypothetical protein
MISEVQAQWINGLSISPSNPTTADSIYAYADCSFTAGGCPPWTMNHSINGSNISANALHCVGMLTVICQYTDTFSLGTLPAGTYTFTFQVDEGHGGPPCTAGIVPGPSASITFTVSVATSVPQISGDNMFSFAPNPVEDKIMFMNKTKAAMPVRIFDVTGKTVMEKIISAAGEEISVSDLIPGIYFLENRGSRFKFIKQ